jgi:hypothetical protein
MYIHPIAPIYQVQALETPTHEKILNIAYNASMGRTIAQTASRQLLAPASRVRSWVNYVGFVVDKVELR